MISSVSTSISYDALIRPDIAGHSAAPELEKETVLPPSNTVQQNQASSGSKAQNENSSSPLITLSSELVTALQGEGREAQETAAEKPPQEKPVASTKEPIETSASGLTDAEEAQIDSLKDRDREVRTHEQAHANTGGQYAGSPSYEYQTGPDGQQYAVGGEVQIDTAPIAGDPAATIAKMETVIRAALAPADPSGQDKAVASAASQKKIEAQADLNALKQSELSGEEADDTIKPTTSANITGATPGTGFVNPASEGGSDTIINLIA